VHAGRCTVATRVITCHWQTHWPSSICWAAALICRISLRLTVLPRVSSITGCVMDMPFSWQKSSVTKVFLLHFLPWKFCSHTFVPAFYCRSNKSYRIQCSNETSTCQEYNCSTALPKNNLPVPVEAWQISIRIQFCVKNQHEFFFRQYSCEYGMPYDIKTVIYAFVFNVINPLNT